MKSLLELLFPQRCAICSKILPVSGERICAECREELPRIHEPKCAVCSQPFNSLFAMELCSDCRGGVPYEKCFVPFCYRDGIQKAIRRMKYYGGPSAYRFFAREIMSELGGFRPDFITFVPQNRKIRRSRGYNQTELMARELGRLLEVEVKSTLVRREVGERQVTLNRFRRVRNAARLFLPKKNTMLSGNCLIVDDVITTGSTMKACCKILRSMGAARVYCAAIAKTVPDYIFFAPPPPDEEN